MFALKILTHVNVCTNTFTYTPIFLRQDVWAKQKSTCEWVIHSGVAAEQVLSNYRVTVLLFHYAYRLIRALMGVFYLESIYIKA